MTIRSGANKSNSVNKNIILFRSGVMNRVFMKERLIHSVNSHQHPAIYINISIKIIVKMLRFKLQVLIGETDVLHRCFAEYFTFIYLCIIS